jgi:hypothetical protein
MTFKRLGRSFYDQPLSVCQLVRKTQRFHISHFTYPANTFRRDTGSFEFSSKQITMSQSNENSSNESNTVGPYDIICGRSSDAYNNIGNRRFRITIRMFLQRYQELENRAERKNFINYLTKLFRTEFGFRFLKKNKDGYFDVGDEEARKKIGHALLDQTMKRRNASDPLKAICNQKNTKKQIPCGFNTLTKANSLTRQVSNESLKSLLTKSTIPRERAVTELESDVCMFLIGLQKGIGETQAVHSSKSRRMAPALVSF